MISVPKTVGELRNLYLNYPKELSEKKERRRRKEREYYYRM